MANRFWSRYPLADLAKAPDLAKAVGSARWWGQASLLMLLIGAGIGLGLLSTAGVNPGTSPANIAQIQQDKAAEDLLPMLSGGSQPATDRLYDAVEPVTAVDNAVTAPIETAVVDAGDGPVAPETPVALPERLVTLFIKSGDTLAGALKRAGLSNGDAHGISTALNKVFNLRKLRAGQQMELVYAPVDAGGPEYMQKLRFRPTPEKEISVSRQNTGDYAASADPVPLTRQLARARGTISDSLYVAGRRAGLPPEVIVDLISIYSWDVDFQREIWAGDQFDVFYEYFVDDTGDVARQGNILFARLKLRDTEKPLYRFTPSGDARTEYFDTEGQSARRALTRTPIDGARLTSRFGARKHPILGYTKMHKGLDFGAPRGTPIKAAGDGVVVRADWYGGYGRYVRIRHLNGYETAYAHMNGFGKGIKKGVKVRQNQVIGYVGSSGRSTGPHLHYEVLYNNKHVNPLALRLPTGTKLAGNDLASFKSHMAETNALINATPAASDLASND